jgi:hypothetical protein
MEAGLAEAQALPGNLSESFPSPMDVRDIQSIASLSRGKVGKIAISSEKPVAT